MMLTITAYEQKRQKSCIQKDAFAFLPTVKEQIFIVFHVNFIVYQ
jgi:hypothetical protein